MKKLVTALVPILSVVFTLSIFQSGAAQADDNPLVLTHVSTVDCDRRAPVVQYTLTRKVNRIGFAVPDSDIVYWMSGVGVSAGTYSMTLGTQPFGSTTQWMLVAEPARIGQAYGLFGSRVLTFVRPARSTCVVARTVHPKRYAQRVTRVCPKGSVKVFTITATIKGSRGYFAGSGVSRLSLRGGRWAKTSGVVVPGARQVEFFYYVPRTARLGKVKASTVTLKLSSKRVDVSLSSVKADCLNQES